VLLSSSAVRGLFCKHRMMIAPCVATALWCNDLVDRESAGCVASGTHHSVRVCNDLSSIEYLM
jgi:hypothetical protein